MNILIVDDEANIRRTLAICLEAEGHRVTAVASAGDAVAEVTGSSVDLIFLDMRLGEEDGLDLIPRLLAEASWLRIVVITAFASIDSAVAALKRGAFDYLPKPFTPDQVRIVTRRVAELRSMEERVRTLADDLDRERPAIDFTSSSPAMRRVIDLARQVAASDASVLLRGENGTGKTMLARAIHGWSPRAEWPLAVVSCPSLSPELLESELFGHVRGAFTGAVRDAPGRIAACDGGTLFLDEIGDLSPAIQAKLLRFIQEREYERLGDPRTRRADVRLITATNVDLVEAVASGRFREDLFYRLNVIQIDLPSLRERPEDVSEMARQLLAFFCRQNRKTILGFSAEALATLQAYSWPGNARELRNIIERAVIFCRADHIGQEHLPESLAPRETPVRLGDPVPLAVIEEHHIRRVLARSASLQEAADILGIDQATLWRRRKSYGI